MSDRSEDDAVNDQPIGLAGSPATEDEWRLYVERRFAHGDARMKGLEEGLADNTELTRDVHEVILAARSGFAAIAKFGRGLAITGTWIAKAVRWLAPVVIAAVAVYHGVQSLLHGGKP
jgi:hypothetical protein